MVIPHIKFILRKKAKSIFELKHLHFLEKQLRKKKVSHSRKILNWYMFHNYVFDIIFFY